MPRYRPLGAVAEEHAAWATSDDPRIPLGFWSIDQRLGGGVAQGEVLMFLAQSGVGKTAWACNVALHNRTRPVVFFSLEMDARMLLQRMAAIYCQRPTGWIEAAVRAQGHSPDMAKVVQDFPHLAIIDDPHMSLVDMGVSLDEVAEAWGLRPRLVIIDYLELIRAKGIGPGEKIDRVSRELKDWSRRHGVATVVLHQLNMGGGRISFSSDNDTYGRRQEMDMGHMPVTTKSARYGGPTAADYVIGAYRPALDPKMMPMEKQNRAPEFFLQVLKIRAGGGLDLLGTRYHYDANTLRLSKWGDPQWTNA